jgi:hypothetical protein
MKNDHQFLCVSMGQILDKHKDTMVLSLQFVSKKLVSKLKPTEKKKS